MSTITAGNGSLRLTMVGVDAESVELCADHCEVTSTYFSAPIVDDATLWGRIAAVAAASGLYALAARPRSATHLFSWSPIVSREILDHVLSGGREAAAAGGWDVDGDSPMTGPGLRYGQTIVGEFDPTDARAELLRSCRPSPGDAVILTKPIGTGLARQAAMVASASPDREVAAMVSAALLDAFASMSTSNAAVVEAALGSGANGCVEVGRFGLLGHLQSLGQRGGVRIVVDPAEVPVLDRAWDLLAAGFVAQRTTMNIDRLRGNLDDGGHDLAFVEMLADPQTSGGLVFTCPPDRSGDALSALGSAGLLAEDIGEVLSVGDGVAGDLLLR